MCVCVCVACVCESNETEFRLYLYLLVLLFHYDFNFSHESIRSVKKNLLFGILQIGMIKIFILHRLMCKA